VDKLNLKDIVPAERYEKRRNEFRDQIIGLKHQRRVPLGDSISLTFENRETIIFQIQEMIRAEHIRDAEKTQQEIDLYNDLIPGPNELSATLFIEIQEESKIREILTQLRGIDNGRSIYFRMGEERIFGNFEGGRSSEEKLSSVHYVKFPFSQKQAKAFISGETPAVLVSDHPHYRASTELTEPVRAELSKDLV